MRNFSPMKSDNSGKKTMGRRKIEIKKIEKKSSLQVTFSKRRQGLFRKASELSVLTGAEIAILIQSPADKIFAFGNPSLESVLDRFQTGEISGIQDIVGEKKSTYDEAVRKLEREKEKEKRMKEGEFWWADEEFERMELHELEEYLGALEGLRDSVFLRVEELENLNLNNCSNLFPDQDFDQRSLKGVGDIKKDGGCGCSWDQLDQNIEGFEDLEDLFYLDNPTNFYM